MLSLFAIMVFCALLTAVRAVDGRGRLFAAGTATLLFCHVYENVAMSVGLMPITGLPLPFISAGRTFLVALVAMMGILQSVNVRAYITSKSERK